MGSGVLRGICTDVDLTVPDTRNYSKRREVYGRCISGKHYAEPNSYAAGSLVCRRRTVHLLLPRPLDVRSAWYSFQRYTYSCVQSDAADRVCACGCVSICNRCSPVKASSVDINACPNPPQRCSNLAYYCWWRSCRDLVGINTGDREYNQRVSNVFVSLGRSPCPCTWML